MRKRGDHKGRPYSGQFFQIADTGDQRIGPGRADHGLA
jgi:hypothetical protein